MSPEPVAPSPMNRAMRDLAAVIDRRTGGRSVPTFELEPILTRLYLAAKIEALEQEAKRQCAGCDRNWPARKMKWGWDHTDPDGHAFDCEVDSLQDTLAKLREEAK